MQKAQGSIDRIFYCPHGEDACCTCRKPKPGLLHQISEYYQTSLHKVPFIGDSWRDIEAAITAGAQPHLVLTGNGRQTIEKHADKLQHIPRHMDLLAFARTYLEP